MTVAQQDDILLPAQYEDTILQLLKRVHLASRCFHMQSSDWDSCRFCAEIYAFAAGFVFSMAATASQSTFGMPSLSLNGPSKLSNGVSGICQVNTITCLESFHTFMEKCTTSQAKTVKLFRGFLFIAKSTSLCWVSTARHHAVASRAP